jgi:hypothetical protein
MIMIWDIFKVVEKVEEEWQKLLGITHNEPL